MKLKMLVFVDCQKHSTVISHKNIKIFVLVSAIFYTFIAIPLKVTSRISDSLDYCQDS